MTEQDIIECNYQLALGERDHVLKDYEALQSQAQALAHALVDCRDMAHHDNAAKSIPKLAQEALDAYNRFMEQSND